jgi:hypothetical protein
MSKTLIRQSGTPDQDLPFADSSPVIPTTGNYYLNRGPAFTIPASAVWQNLSMASTSQSEGSLSNCITPDGGFICPESGIYRVSYYLPHYTVSSTMETSLSKRKGSFTNDQLWYRQQLSAVSSATGSTSIKMNKGDQIWLAIVTASAVAVPIDNYFYILIDQVQVNTPYIVADDGALVSSSDTGKVSIDSDSGTMSVNGLQNIMPIFFTINIDTAYSGIVIKTGYLRNTQATGGTIYIKGENLRAGIPIDSEIQFNAYSPDMYSGFGRVDYGFEIDLVATYYDSDSYLCFYVNFPITSDSGYFHLNITCHGVADTIFGTEFIQSVTQVASAPPTTATLYAVVPNNIITLFAPDLGIPLTSEATASDPFCYSTLRQLCLIADIKLRTCYLAGYIDINSAYANTAYSDLSGKITFPRKYLPPLGKYSTYLLFDVNFIKTNGAAIIPVSGYLPLSTLTTGVANLTIRMPALTAGQYDQAYFPCMSWKF